MKNCFTETISYLDQKYDLPQVWGKWTWNDLEAFVKHQNKMMSSFGIVALAFVSISFFTGHMIILKRE